MRIFWLSSISILFISLVSVFVVDRSQVNNRGQNGYSCDSKVVIRTETGDEELQLEDIERGDFILVRENSFEKVIYAYGKDNVKLLEFTTKNGGKLKLTDGHLMYIKNNLIAANDVKIGDKLTLTDGSLSEIIEKKAITGSTCNAFRWEEIS